MRTRLSALSILQRSLAAHLLLVIGGCSSVDPMASDYGRHLRTTGDQVIKFTTTEATHSHVDVSPDGKTVVFDVLGDLYEVELSGGEAKQLTFGAGFDLMPRYSPDGRTIAFMSDRSGSPNLWLSKSDGTGVEQVTQEWRGRLSPPVWTAAGSLLVQVYDKDDAEMLTGVRDGSGAVAISPMHLLPAQASMAYTGTGGYAVGIEGGMGPSLAFPSLPMDKLSHVDLESSQAEVTDIQGIEQPRVSKDGKLLAYVVPDGYYKSLVVRSLSSGEQKTLIRKLPMYLGEAYQEEDRVPSFSFTPDSRSIVLWHDNELKRVWIDSAKVDAIPVTIPVTVQVSEPVHADRQHAFDSPLISRVVRWPQLDPFRNFVVSGVFGEICISQVHDRSTECWKSGGDFDFAPSLSPSGDQIAYVRMAKSGRGNIRVRGLTSGEDRTLTTVPGRFLNPTWSNDGATIAYLALRTPADERGTQSDFELRIVSSAAPAASAVVAEFDLPSVAGERIYPVISFTEDDAEVRVVGAALVGRDKLKDSTFPITENAYAVRRDGSSIRKILSVPSSDEAVVSPKGTKVALTTHNRLYIAKVASAESALVDLTGGRQVAERGTATYVSWVNDDEVIWADGNEIRIANANNGEVSLLTKVSVSRTRKVAPGRCAVINAKIVTMRGGEIIEKGALGIEGGRIIAVEPMSRFHVSDYHCKIDASGATIIPGLMDVHAHVKSDDPSELSELWTHEFANYTAALAYGVTTSYDPSTITALGPIGISEMIDIGKILGPRVFSAGPPMYGDDGWESRSDYVRDRSQEDATEAIERRSGQVNGPLKEYSHPLRKQRRWMATAARRWQTPITAEGGDRITNLAFVLDGYTAFEHPIPVWPIGDDVAKLLAATSVGYTPIISSDGNGLPQKYVSRDKLSANIKFNRFTPAAEKRLKPVLGRDQKINDAVNFLMNLTAKNAARILSSGGMVSTGTHGGTWIGVHYEMEELVSGGASNHDALRAATIIPAKKLDIDHSLGSIEVGKIADLVVLDADPLKDIKATQLIRFVVKDGRIFDAASMSEIKELSKSSQGLGTASSYAGRIN